VSRPRHLSDAQPPHYNAALTQASWPGWSGPWRAETRALRILWISERFPPQRGGVAQAAARQSSLVAPQLERLDLLCLTADLPAGQVEASEWAGVTVHRIGGTGRREESLQLLMQAALALWRRHEHQLIHGFYAVFAGYAAVLLAQQVGRRSLVSLRGNDVDLGMFQGSRLPFLRWTLEKADAIAAVSRELEHKAQLLTKRSAGVSYLPNSVDSEVFCPGDPPGALLAELAPYPRPWIGFSGELRFKKGLSALAALAAELARKNGGTLFVIGGVRRDEQEGYLRWRAAEPEAAAHLIELPYRRNTEQLLAYYRAIDLFVFPSLWEGMPNALLEVMACGKPVIATRVGGISDVIGDSGAGVLIDATELDQLPAQVDRVLTLAPNERAAIGQAARERVRSSFNLSGEREALLSLYRTLV
jgi:phosphatidylinositol alpha-1,6-mannosyltransferase